jgi:hypothetical protein
LVAAVPSAADAVRALTAAAILLALAACTSAEEKARQRDSAMIAQAIADSVAEKEFLEDSSKLAASITVDTVRARRIRNQPSPENSDVLDQLHEVVSPSGHVCALTAAKYQQVVIGDTLSCQWAPAP